MSATATGVAYDPRAKPAKRLRWAARDFRLLEWAFVAVTVQTILYNPVLGPAGPLAIYLSALTWPLLSLAAVVRVLQRTDADLKRATAAVLVSTALLCALIAIQLGVMGLQVYSLSTLPKLAYLPAGMVACLAVVGAADRLLDLIVVVLGVKCAFLLLQAFQGPIDLLHRISPLSLGGANTFAMFVGLVVVLRLSTWILAGRRPGPLVFLALPVCVVALSLTFTRGALIALAVGLVAILTLSTTRRGARTGLLAALVLVAMTVLLIFQAPVRDRLTAVGPGASSGRVEIAQAAWEGINGSPVLGHGLGSFRFSGPFVIEFSGAGSNTTPSAHNLYLQVLYEGGLVGLAAVVLAVFILMRPSWSSILVPACLMLAVQGMFETFPYVIQTSWVIGVVLAVGLHHRQVGLDDARSTDRP